MTRRLFKALVSIAAIAVMFMGTQADAKPSKYQNNNVQKVQFHKSKIVKVKKIKRPKHRHGARHAAAPAASPVVRDWHGVVPGCHPVAPEIGVRRTSVPAVADYSWGGRPAGCPHAWCGCWLALHKFGRNVRHLWLARNWAYEGQAASRGCLGCVAVLSRGRRGGHVGIVVGWDGPNPITMSGNHNRRVGTGTYPARRLIALRSV